MGSYADNDVTHSVLDDGVADVFCIEWTNPPAFT